MSTTKNLRLARFLKGFLDFIFGLLVFVGVGLVLWTVFSPLILGQSGALGTASLPVRIGSGEEPQFEVTFSGATRDRIETAFVDEAEGTLRLETNSYWLILIANIAKVVTAAGLAYVFYQLRAFVKLILDGNPFAEQAGLHLKRLGYAVILVGVGSPVIQFFSAWEIFNRLPTTVPALSPGPTFNAEVILGSLLVLLLAHVWSYGLDLERERALTI